MSPKRLSSFKTGRLGKFPKDSFFAITLNIFVSQKANLLQYNLESSIGDSFASFIKLMLTYSVVFDEHRKICSG